MVTVNIKLIFPLSHEPHHLGRTYTNPTTLYIRILDLLSRCFRQEQLQFQIPDLRVRERDECVCVHVQATLSPCSTGECGSDIFIGNTTYVNDTVRLAVSGLSTMCVFAGSLSHGLVCRGTFCEELLRSFDRSLCLDGIDDNQRAAGGEEGCEELRCAVDIHKVVVRHRALGGGEGNYIIGGLHAYIYEYMHARKVHDTHKNHVKFLTP